MDEVRFSEMQKEPLIKDERIRKVVRLCADIWGANKILAIKSGSRIEFSDGTPNMRYASFMYAEWQDEIKDRIAFLEKELADTKEFRDEKYKFIQEYDGKKFKNITTEDSISADETVTDE